MFTRVPSREGRHASNPIHTVRWIYVMLNHFFFSIEACHKRRDFIAQKHASPSPTILARSYRLTFTMNSRSSNASSPATSSHPRLRCCRKRTSLGSDKPMSSHPRCCHKRRKRIQAAALVAPVPLMIWKRTMMTTTKIQKRVYCTV